VDDTKKNYKGKKQWQHQPRRNLELFLNKLVDDDDNDEFPPPLTSKSVLRPTQTSPIPRVRSIFFSEGKSVGAWTLSLISNAAVNIEWIYTSRKSYRITSLNRPLGLQEVEVPGISGQSAHEGGNVVSPTHRSPFCWRLSRRHGHSKAGRIGSMRNPSEPNGNPTRTFRW
jgi:hypothetical protein